MQKFHSVYTEECVEVSIVSTQCKFYGATRYAEISAVFLLKESK